ncbi:MAG: class I SAM-dependent methyltransferase [Clostridiales bacterium]|jgi:23S rRNA (cytosine1962-C5)-methyltransferase|nr:class I SAM-dependent methyltransferase [Clostridiales bacterium]
MYLADQWKDYKLLHAGDGKKLERWGDITLLRPDPQAVWPMLRTTPAVCADAIYIRADTGGGHWEYRCDLPESWQLAYHDLRFLVRPTGFKHTGLFPEQAANWDWMRQRVQNRPQARVLNLFAYTGGATCACAAAGASVVHVDAARGMVQWARQNLALSGLSGQSVRFLVDDTMKFVLREGRRGNMYDGIVMDPPSYGRGPGGELWKIEQDLYPLAAAATALLSHNPLFFLINSYTTGLAASVLQDVLRVALGANCAHIEAAELCLPIADGRGLVLPCGASARAWW